MNACRVSRRHLSNRRPYPLTLLRKCYRGSSLIVCLLILIVVLMLGSSVAQMALQEEKAARNARDRQIALEAAEAALRDAELDMENSSRSHLFADKTEEGFTKGCSAVGDGFHLGLCMRSEAGDVPAWKSIDLAGGSGQTQSVPYGQFTGQRLQTGDGLLPAKQPRYIIELIPFGMHDVHAPEGRVVNLYRVTSIGFGVRESTQVVLQTFYRKAGDGGHSNHMPNGRLSWREISNWKEMHDALENG